MKKILLLLLTLMTYGSTDGWASPQQIIKLKVGESYVLEQKIAKMSLSNADVVAVKLREEKALFFALSPGESLTHLWLENGKQKTLQVAVYSQQRYMLEQFLGIYVQSKSIYIHKTPTTIWLTGEASAEEGEQLHALAANFKELDLSQLKVAEKKPQMIELEVQVVEIKRSYLKQTGLKWSPTAQGPALGLLSDWLGGQEFKLFNDTSPGWQPSVSELAQQTWQGIHGYAGIQTSLSSTLRLLEERGEAEILATPRLRLESGEQANFLAGGELPIPQLNKEGAMDVTFHPYGIKVVTAVQVQSNGFIKTQIEAELSRIDYSVAVQGVPGLLTRRSHSVVVLKPRETVVLSGLKSRESQTQRGGLPGHRRIWQRFAGLFSGAEKSRQETELLVFITPKIVADEEARKNRKMERSRQYKEQLKLAGCRGLNDLTS